MTDHAFRRLLWPLVSTAALLAAAPATAVEPVKLMPFKAGLSFTELLAPTSDCLASAPAGGSALGGTLNGSGVASRIGAFTITSQDCIASASPNFLPPYTFSGKQVTLRTPNGDELVATYSGTATAQANGALALSGSFTFTGGTGRFAGVQGTGRLDGVEDISTSPATGIIVLTGQISR